jgi:3,4-dihydroxy-9,10-secoandrosta-1,3,5(10)-triene-9,17-dione 4,5-dioxygenase
MNVSDSKMSSVAAARAPKQQNAMNLRELGYVVLETSDIQKWRVFAEQVVGMQACDGPDGALYLKIDQRHHRILILPAGREKYAASGWALRSKQEFDDAFEALSASGVNVELGKADACRLRYVQGFMWFDDPSGNRHEIFWGPISDFKPFVSPIGTGKFVTGDLGMGHTVLPAANIDETRAFWTSIGGLGDSDSLLQPVTADLTVQLYFMHCRNARQHSMALAQMPSDVGCIHLALEFAELDDVGLAIDRVNAHKIPVAMTLGKHTNDDMISFYFMSPGNFILELGWGAKPKDWDNELVHETTLGSQWGHKWVLNDPNFQVG